MAGIPRSETSHFRPFCCLKPFIYTDYSSSYLHTSLRKVNDVRV